MPIPSKIVCVGRNYAAHATEMGNEVPAEPLIFLKPPSSMIADGADILLPPQSRRVEFEGEIGVIVGERMRHVSGGDASSGVAAIVAANDVTARDLQRSDGQWSRAKGFDTFCPVGVPAASFPAFDELVVTTRVNGEERQRAAGSDMVFPIPVLLSFISSIMTLEPGDLVLTGTPSGVGQLEPGDTVEVEIEGVSIVTNPVRAGY